MSDGGKGSKPRPFSISQEDYADKFDAIFGKKITHIIVDEFDDKITRNNEETQEVLKQK
jgi:hypothetical protein